MKIEKKTYEIAGDLGNMIKAYQAKKIKKAVKNINEKVEKVTLADLLIKATDKWQSNIMATNFVWLTKVQEIDAQYDKDCNKIIAIWRMKNDKNNQVAD